ncbi:MAG TPA: cache domain-containing protein, partial [Negativicutes bacterium]
MKNLSIKSHLWIAFAIIAIIPVIFLSAIQIRQIYDIQEINKKKQLQTVRELADSVENFIDYQRNAVETLATQLTVTQQQEKNGVTAMLQAVQNNFPGFANISVVNRDGTIIAFYPAQLVPDNDYAQKAAAAKSTIIVPAVSQYDGGYKPAVAIVVPLFDNEHHVAGYVSGILDMRQIELLVSRYDYEGAYPVIADSTGQAIYVPKRENKAMLLDLADEVILSEAAANLQGQGIYYSGLYERMEAVTYQKINNLGWTVWLSKSYKEEQAMFYSSLWSMSLMIIIMLLLSLLLGYLHANRINSTINLLVEYIQRIIGEGYDQPVKFPKFAPSEFDFLARHFFIMAKKIKDSQQALQELNAELEQRVAERTKSLVRTNRELAILNQLITPVTPYPGTVSIIEGCIDRFFEVANIRAILYLTKPVISLLGSYEDVNQNAATDDGVQHKNSFRYYIQPIRSGQTTFGHFVVPNSPLSEADRKFLQTLSHSAGIIFQKEILSRTLQQNHAVLKAVLESMYDAIVLIDNRHEVIYVNGRMVKMLDIPYDKLCSSSESFLFDVVAGMLIDADQELIKQIRQEYGIYKLKIKLGNNQERYKLLSAFPVLDDKHNTIGKGYLWRDITKEHEVSKLKNDLISLVSHEFKTPMTSIKGSVETLLRQDAG